MMGLWILVLIVLSGIRHCLRAIAWRYCVDPGAQPQRFVDLFSLKLIGEFVTDLAPGGPFFGETVKAWAASKSLSARFGVTSVVIEDLIYSFGTGLFVLTGFLILLVTTADKYHLERSGKALVFSAVTLLGLAIIVWQGNLARTIYLCLRNTRRGRALIARYGQAVRSWGTLIRDFFRTRRALLLTIISIEILVNVISFGETYFILRRATAHASYLNAYLVESANRCAQLVASFVPFGLGVDEGTTTATLHSLGRTLSEGVSVAAIRKIRSLFWDLIGLGMAAHFLLARRPRDRALSLAPGQREDAPAASEIALAERIL
jgi:uncharacterized protein (TIRG00374 family)